MADVTLAKLVAYPEPLAVAHGRTDGTALASDLFELAGAEPVGTYR